MRDIKDLISENENVQETVRRHWVNIAPLMTAWVTLGLFGLLGIFMIARYPDNFGGQGSAGFGLLAAVALISFALLLGYVTWWVYRQNRLIITDKNLYQITQSSLFSKRVAQFDLGRLQDVSASQEGFFPTSLDYGDVTVETAGEEENFVFKQAPHPRELAARIMECHKQYVGGDLKTEQEGL
jgi:hypothetical protein